MAANQYRLNLLGSAYTQIADPSSAPVSQAGLDSASWDQVNLIRQGLNSFSSDISELHLLHERSLNRSDHSEFAARVSTHQEVLRKTARKLSSQIRDLADAPSTRSSEALIGQVKALSEKHRGLLGEWQEEERRWRAKVRETAARQLKIVKPGVTQEELEKALDSGVEGQALVSGSRRTESQSAFRAVQDRQEEMRKIERTLEELATMFSDISLLIERQEEVLQVIEKAAETVETDMEAGAEHLVKGTERARKTRSKRKFCFFLSIGIVLILIVIILLVLQFQFHVFSPKKP